MHAKRAHSPGTWRQRASSSLVSVVAAAMQLGSVRTRFLRDLSTSVRTVARARFRLRCQVGLCTLLQKASEPPMSGVRGKPRMPIHGFADIRHLEEDFEEFDTGEAGE